MYSENDFGSRVTLVCLLALAPQDILLSHGRTRAPTVEYFRVYKCKTSNVKSNEWVNSSTEKQQDPMLMNSSTAVARHSFLVPTIAPKVHGAIQQQSCNAASIPPIHTTRAGVYAVLGYGHNARVSHAALAQAHKPTGPVLRGRNAPPRELCSMSSSPLFVSSMRVSYSNRSSTNRPIAIPKQSSVEVTIH